MRLLHWRSDSDGSSPAVAPATKATVPALETVTYSSVMASGQAWPVVVVHGPPGAGKSRLARGLARSTGLPCFDRDEFKDTIFDALGYSDREWSITVGKASWDLLTLMAERLSRMARNLRVDHVVVLATHVDQVCRRSALLWRHQRVVTWPPWTGCADVCHFPDRLRLVGRTGCLHNQFSAAAHVSARVAALRNHDAFLCRAHGVTSPLRSRHSATVATSGARNLKRADAPVARGGLWYWCPWRHRSARRVRMPWRLVGLPTLLAPLRSAWHGAEAS